MYHKSRAITGGILDHEQPRIPAERRQVGRVCTQRLTFLLTAPASWVTKGSNGLLAFSYFLIFPTCLIGSVTSVWQPNFADVVPSSQKLRRMERCQDIGFQHPSLWPLFPLSSPIWFDGENPSVRDQEKPDLFFLFSFLFLVSFFFRGLDFCSVMKQWYRHYGADRSAEQSSGPQGEI